MFGHLSQFAMAVMVFVASAASDPPASKRLTDRSIVMDVIVEAGPSEVFDLWLDEAGTAEFFGHHARIEARVGGAYEIYFLEAEHPDSDANSSKGAKVLALEPARFLSFEWTAPPFAAELNTDPLPMWVEVSFEPLEGHRDRTHVRVAHYGFGRSESWDRTYEFFVRAWTQILYRLDRYFVRHPAGSAG